MTTEGLNQIMEIVMWWWLGQTVITICERGSYWLNTRRGSGAR